MSRVLIIGTCPLPDTGTRFLTGPSLRTSQIASALSSDGHELRLVCVDTSCGPDSTCAPSVRKTDGLTVHAYDVPSFSAPVVAEHEKEFRPDCMISIGSYLPLSVTSSLKTSKPLLFDLYGDLMAEAQVRAAVEQDDRWVDDFWELLQAVLARGDAFSAVSARQRLSLVGLLGAAGRLTGSTRAYEFVHVVPCSVPAIPCGPGKPPRLRGRAAGENDFIILWSGSFNTWADIDTLCKGVELSMEKDPGIKFVSTGGAAPGHCSTVYERFSARITSSKNRERYVLLGWVPAGHLHAYYSESNVAVNADLPCYEAELGSRNRVLDWMACGLPVVSTATCELTQELADAGMITAFQHSDSEALASAILDVREKEPAYKETAARSAEYVMKHFSHRATTESLRKWAAKPARAPDAAGQPRAASRAMHIRQENRSLSGELATAKQEIGRLKQHGENILGELKGLSTHAQNLESERDGLKVHARNLEVERDGLRVHARNLENERDSLKVHAENLERERDGLKTHAASLAKELDSSKAASSALQQQNEGLKARLDELISSKDYRLGNAIMDFLRKVTLRKPPEKADTR